MENLYDKRKVYEKSQLLENQIKENPIEMFRDWFLEAEENPAVSEANAMAVSTVEADGCPRTRMVLLKAYTWEGFIFYTNYNSKKGKALEKIIRLVFIFLAKFRKTNYYKSRIRKSS
jgi:pyridoxamine 5'-phosphate oxidase